MSHRYRRSYLAARRGVLGIVAALAMSHGVALAVPMGHVVTAPSHQTAKAVRHAVDPAPGAESEIYIADCGAPKDVDEAALCEQQRAAIAAEETRDLTHGQNWIVGFIAFLLLLALAAAAFAALAALRAAKAFNASAEAARRAYLSAAPHFDAGEIDKREPHYRITIENRGQTPAHDVTGWVDGALVAHPCPANKLPLGKRQSVARMVLAPGEKLDLGGSFETPLSDEDVPAILGGSRRFYFWGEVLYRDAFKERRSFRFKYMFGGASAGDGRVDMADDGNEAD